MRAGHHKQTAAFLIDALDKAEPDPDLEDGGDEIAGDIHPPVGGAS
jgi:hypothetical protein